MTTPHKLSSRYEMGEMLGFGGMAEVHRGRDLRLGRDVADQGAAHRPRPRPHFQVRFRREAQNAAALNHPAIVAVYDTGEDRTTDGGPLPYIVMEYVEGDTLRDVLRREGHLTRAGHGARSPTSAGRWTSATATASCTATSSPANVMITPQGAVKVMDFGIARAVSDSRRHDDRRPPP